MPAYRFLCSHCNLAFELRRPPSQEGKPAPCPKCGESASAQLSWREAAPPPSPSPFSPLERSRELPPWVEGQVRAQVNQLLPAADAVGGVEREVIVEQVLRQLQGSQVKTPADIVQVVRQHLEKMESWARSARRMGARLDVEDQLEGDEE